MRHLMKGILSILLGLGPIGAVSVSPAQQAAPAVDLTGKWVFQVVTSAGGGAPTFVFKQDGEKLTGHYSGQLGEADLAGTVKGQAVDFKFSADVQGVRIDATYSGRIESKDSMKGTVTLIGLGEGTFTGKRQ